MELILVRHALPERVENVEGVADPGLQPIGHEQSRRMAEWLAHEDIHHIAVSPKRRAVETAAPLAERLGLEPEVVPGFAEIDRASRTYIPVEQMRRENNAHWQALVNGDWAKVGFTDPSEFQKEVVAAKDDLLARFPDHRIVIVAHGGTINAIVSQLIGLDRMFFFDAGYTSISRVVRGYSGRYVVHSLNETAHLDTARRTLEPLPPI
ncbi:MAG TPA: histidine phosphatase family protein [Acidimicrobiales bacterium]|jgi:probable phosphoglycerate mutase|nr:histidine phosphatase family protein [Acidimicrobiales bacterium]